MSERQSHERYAVRNDEIQSLRGRARRPRWAAMRDAMTAAGASPALRRTFHCHPERSEGSCALQYRLRFFVTSFLRMTEGT